MDDYKYKAFISYKHSASTVFAEKLETAIKKYAKPLWRRPLPIFRDEKYLKPGIDLPGMIRAALNQSEYFIYLASPEAAHSTWVQQEVELWMTNPNRIHKVIIVLTDGQLVYNPTTKEIDWGKTNSLAPQFQSELKTVPNYVDCRKFRTLEQQSLNYPDFKKAVNAIVAALRNVDPLELNSEEVRQYRRNLNLLRGLFTVILVLAVSWAGIAFYAWQQKIESEINSRFAHARELGAKAELIRSTQPDSIGRALWLAAESMRISPTSQAEETLHRIMDLSPRKQFVIYEDLKKTEKIYIEFSPDGKFLLCLPRKSETDRKTICVWDAKTGQMLHTLKHDDTVTIATFTPDSKHIVSGSTDLTARLWKLDDGLEQVRISHVDELLDTKISNPVTTITVSPNGRFVASAGRKGRIKAWEVSTGNVIYNLDEASEISKILFSPDSSQIAVANEKNRVLICSMKTGRQRVLSFKNRSHVLDYGNKKELLLNDDAGNIKYFDLTSGQSRDLFKSIDRIGKIVLSSDRRYIAAAEPFMIYSGTPNIKALPQVRVWIWDLQKRKVVFENYNSENVYALCISPDNRWLAISRGWVLQIWDIKTGSELIRIAQGQMIHGVIFSSDGKRFVTQSQSGVVWGVNTGMEYSCFSHHEAGNPKTSDVVYDIAFTPDGRFLVSAGGDGTARVWDIMHGIEIHQVKHKGTVTSVDISADGHIAASATNTGELRVWQTTDGKEIRRFIHPGKIWSIDLNPSGSLLLSGGLDRKVILWSIKTGEVIQDINLDTEIELVAFSPNGELFGAAIGGNKDQSLSAGSMPLLDANKVWIWDTNTMKHMFSAIHEFNGEPFLSHNSRINVFAFSGNAKMLLTGSYDKTARSWDIITGKELVRIVHNSSIRAVGFLPKKDIAFSVAKDGLNFWDPFTGRTLLHIPEVTHGPIQFSQDGNLFVDGDGQVWESHTGVYKAGFLHGRGERPFFQPSSFFYHGLANDIAWGSKESKEKIAFAIGNEIRIWELDPEGLFAEICRRPIYIPSKEEWRKYFRDQPYNPICIE